MEPTRERQRCNMCGGEMTLWDVQQPSRMSGYIQYGSEYDGDVLELHLCCGCLDRLIRACAITPVQEVHK